MAYTDQVAGSRRFTTMAGVAAIHVVLGYALVSGMAVNVARTITRTLTTTNIDLPTPPPPDTTPPPPEHHATTATKTQSTTITLVHPLVETNAADTRVAVDPDPLPPLPLPTGAPYVAPSPTPSLASGVAILGNRGGWITNDDYPASALSAEEEGRVAVTVQIGANGRVTSCSVTASSGSPVLDRTTCRLYGQRARFTPARDDAGHPVASTYSDRVRWELPR